MLVLPSYREGFGNVVIEAEAMGVPVIVTDIPGPRDAMVPGETGLIVEKANAEALYGAMEQMIQDAGNCGANGRVVVEEHFEQQAFFKHILEDRKRLFELG